MDEKSSRSLYLPVITPLLVSIQFLTIIPPLIRREVTAKEIGLATSYFPIAGFVIGGIISLSSLWSSELFKPEISAALLLAVWIILTGALHVDGFIDSCDGLFGGKSADGRLKIMRDERIGAYGFIGGFILLLLKYLGIVASMSWRIFILSPIIGRWMITLVLVIFPYARKTGLGKSMKENASYRQVLIAAVITISSCWLIAGIQGALMMIAITVFAWIMGLGIYRSIGGLTGDSYGAICEMSEVIVLITFPLLEAAIG